MYIKSVFFFVFLGLWINSHAQGIYNVILDAGADENPRTVTVGHDENVVICGKSNINSNKAFAWAFLLDSNGNYLKDISISDPDYSVELRNIYKTKTGYRFLGLKTSSTASFNQQVFIYETDKSLTPTDSFEVFLTDTLKMIGYRVFQDKDTNYVFHGYAQLMIGVSPPVPCVFKTDRSGNILHQQMGNYSNYTGWLNYNLMENFSGDGYLLFSQYPANYSAPVVLNINTDLSVKPSGHMDLPDSVKIGSITSSMYDYFDVVKFNARFVFIARAGIDDEDFYLTKIDTSGNVLNMLVDKGEDDYYLHGGINSLDYNNDYIYVSYQDSVVSGLDFPTHTNKIIIRKVDTSLNIIWDKRLGLDAYYWHSDVYATNDGGCLVLASVYDKDTMMYQNDIILFKLDANGNVTGTHRIENPGGSVLNAYPNPGKDHFYVDGVNGSVLQVYSQNGKKLLEQQLNTGRNKVEMGKYPSGIYVLRLVNKEGRPLATAKWIKQ